MSDKPSFFRYKSSFFLFILIFIENVLNTYIRSRVRLSDGRNGEVIMINKQKLSRPLIRSGSCYIDLSKEPDAVYIEEIL